MGNSPFNYRDPFGFGWFSDFVSGVKQGLKNVAKGLSSPAGIITAVAVVAVSIALPPVGAVIAAASTGYAIGATAGAGIGMTTGLMTPEEGGQIVGEQTIPALVSAGVSKSAAALGNALRGEKGAAAAANCKPGYAPNRPLPRDPVTGNPIPETTAPHTQLGMRTSKNTGETYRQAREFGEGGKHVKDIDFTDHGRPATHPNPHQHSIDPSTGKRGPSEPLKN